MADPRFAVGGRAVDKVGVVPLGNVRGLQDLAEHGSGLGRHAGDGYFANYGYNIDLDARLGHLASFGTGRVRFASGFIAILKGGVNF